MSIKSAVKTNTQLKKDLYLAENELKALRIENASLKADNDRLLLEAVTAKLTGETKPAAGIGIMRNPTADAVLSAAVVAGAGVLMHRFVKQIKI